MELNPDPSPDKPEASDHHFSEVELTYPPVPAPAPTTPPAPQTRAIKPQHTMVFALLAAFVAGCVGSFAIGYSTAKSLPLKTSASLNAQTPLQVPAGATIISQCAVGRGTQYVLPSDIPHGPVYNVSNGKVIGLEFMIGKDDLSQGTSYINLPLYGKTYDHIDVGLLSQGHAGYPQPHYHVDVYNVSRATSAAVTCK